MKPRFLAIILLQLICVCGLAQRRQTYLFENNFKNAFPTCNEELSAAAQDPRCATGSAAVFVHDSIGCEKTSTVFQSKNNAGLLYQNTAGLIGEEYTILIYVKSSSWGLTPIQLLGFVPNAESITIRPDSTGKNGLIYYRSKNLSTTQSQMLSRNTYHLISITRSKSTDQVDVFLNDQKIITIEDTRKRLIGKTGEPFNIYRQPASEACKTGTTNFGFVSISDQYATAEKIAKHFAGICESAQKKASVQFYIDPNTSCKGQDINIQFTGNIPDSDEYEFIWDFAGASTIKGSGRGPYKIQWEDRGKKTVTLKVRNKQCGAEMTDFKEKYVCGVKEVGIEVTDQCDGFAEIKLQLPAGTPPFYYSFNGSDLSEKSLYYARNGDYKITFTDVHKCFVDTMVHISLKEPALIETIEDVTICEGESIELTTVTNADYISWNPSNDMADYTVASPVLKPQYTTTYIATASKDICVNSDTVTVTVLPSPHIIVSPDTRVEEMDPYQLFAIPYPKEFLNDWAYEWTPTEGLNNPVSSLPVATIEETQTYQVKVTNEYGCSAIDSTTIHVISKPKIYIPTAFTPNGDTHNQTLIPIYVSIKELKSFTVYSRDGTVVFATQDQQEGWNGLFRGTQAPVGNYTYLIRAISEEGEPVERRGSVLLIR